jgi:hypothetical protein
MLPQEEPKKDATDEDAAANQPFDHFMGNDTGAFAYGDYDQDDKEADETYAKIEELMGERRKVCLHLGLTLQDWMTAKKGTHICHQLPMHPCASVMMKDAQTFVVSLQTQPLLSAF